MEGLEISEVNLSQLESSARIDSEYYKSSYLEYENILKKKNGISLDKVSNFLIGPFGSSFTVENYTYDKTYRYIRGKDVKPLILMDNDNVYMPHIDYERLKKYSLKEKDILISVVGTLGNAAIVTKKEIPAIFSCKSTVLRTKDINPIYLLVYINTKFGQNLLQRKERGAIQKGLNLDDLKTLPVFISSMLLQNKIEELFSNSLKKLESSKAKYKNAEELLLETIGLKDFKPTNEKINIKSFKDSFIDSGRLDSEYYLPRYIQILELIKSNKNGYNSLDEFISSYSTGYPYKSDDYQEYGLTLIRINNIRKGLLDLSDTALLPEKQINLSPKDIVKQNDILISMSGTIGNSCIVPPGITAVINQRIMKITSKDYNPNVLSLIINSIVGLYQLERVGTGGLQTNISANDIRNILIPRILESEQNKISDLMEKSYELKQQSEKLLEVAKKAVEIAIEENEEEALKYISENS